MAPRKSDRRTPISVGRACPMEEMKERYRAVQEEIRRLEAERAEAIGRGDPVSGRIRLGLAEARISAEEFRMWGNRELTRQLREVL
jgi:hypothetical protein